MDAVLHIAFSAAPLQRAQPTTDARAGVGKERKNRKHAVAKGGRWYGRLRAAIQIHETTHFVGDNPDTALEWQTDAYAALTPELALRNPADDRSRPVFHPSVRGRTDQFVYKFRKPR